MMRFLHAIFAPALLTPILCPSSFAQSSFTVGTATAAPGQKATGYLEVPAGVDPATNIPVVVVNGTKPGKVLALISGAHGTQYASIIAIEKLIAALDPEQVTVTVRPSAASPPALPRPATPAPSSPTPSPSSSTAPSVPCAH